jgi:hypothetical protein
MRVRRRSIGRFETPMPRRSGGRIGNCGLRLPRGCVASVPYLLDPLGVDPDPPDSSPFSPRGWTPAPTANTVDVDGGLGFTTCYNSASCVLSEQTAVGSSTVMSWLEVIQHDASGLICNITATPTFTDIVSAHPNVHHFGRTFRAKGVPVLSSCGSRVFTVRIYVQLIAGDNIKEQAQRRHHKGWGFGFRPSAPRWGAGLKTEPSRNTPWAGSPLRLRDLHPDRFAAVPSHVLGLIEQGVRLRKRIGACLGSTGQHWSPLITDQGGFPRGRSSTSAARAFFWSSASRRAVALLAPDGGRFRKGAGTAQ